MSLEIVGVDVFDGRDLRRGAHGVSVRDDRIAPEADPAAVTIDLASVPGATALPGLIDAHVHLTLGGTDPDDKRDPLPLAALRMVRNGMENLRAGVTSVRDLGARGHVDLHYRRGLQLGLVQGPRTFVSGRPVTAVGGHCAYMGEEVDGPDAARRATERQVAAGVDWAKVMVTGGLTTPGTDPRRQQVDGDVIRAVVEAAHAAGVPVAAHGQGGPGVHAALRAGVDSLEHGIWLDDEAIDLMLDGDVAYVPTLSAVHLIAEAAEVGGVTPPPDAVEKARIAREAHRESFARAVRAGVRIVAGTDYLHGSLPYEARLMAEAGMPATDVLRSATVRAAELLGRPDLGAIEPGRTADLIVVRGDPTRDPAALERVLLVVQGGRVVHHDASIRERVGAAA